MVNGGQDGLTSDLSSSVCSMCEMTVTWMQNQLNNNQTNERILDYVNQVNSLTLAESFFFNSLVTHWKYPRMPRVPVVRATSESNG